MGYTIVAPYAFVTFALCGAALGLLYGIFAVFIKACGIKAVELILDVLLVLAAAAVFIICMWKVTAGGFRAFALMGYLLGFAASAAGPGALITNMGLKLLSIIKKWLIKLKKIVGLEKTDETD